MNTPSSIPHQTHLSHPIELAASQTADVGGGLIGLLLLGGAALFLAGCQSCTAHGNAGKRPTTPPGN